MRLRNIKAEYIKSVYLSDDIPKKTLPEFVICGRSNSGKSTFLNLLSLIDQPNSGSIEILSKKILSIPFHPYLNYRSQKKIIDILKKS